MKKAKQNDLAQAQVLFARREYGQVISLLVPQIVLYRKDVAFYEILGFACLYTEDFGGAYSYLKRARDIDPKKVEVLLGLALVLLRRRKITEALKIWLDILEIDPQNAQARRALDMARRFNENDWREMIENKTFAAILPPRHYFPLRKIILYVLGAALSALVLLFVIALLQREPPYRANAELLEFEQDDYSPADYSQFASIIFTEQELEKKLDEIRRYFHQFRDNLVRYQGNQVLMSNAPFVVKDRISFIIAQLQVPSFTDFQDNFEYSQIAEAPALYNGIYVRWRGRVANLVIGEQLIAFDLLVGFDTGRVVRGTVPVILDFAVNLQGGEAVEIIARVSSEDGEIKLTASSIRLIVE